MALPSLLPRSSTRRLSKSTLCEICVTECCTVVMGTAIAMGAPQRRRVEDPRIASERSEPILSGAPFSPGPFRSHGLHLVPDTLVTNLNRTGLDWALTCRSRAQSSQASLLKGVAVDLTKHGPQYFFVDQAQAGHEVRDKRFPLGSCGLKC